jgi:hypothetical protein
MNPSAPRTAALPFVIRRSHDVIGKEITSTTETIHGLLRLECEALTIQWRVARETDRVGSEIRTDHEVEPVRETVIPVGAIAGAALRRRGWWWPFGRGRVVLTGATLRAFEPVAGAAGLGLRHPAELVLEIRRGDRAAALEFVAELELAVADHALQIAEGAPRGLLPDRP